jgi:serine/threonine-protein kinase ATR
MTATISRSLEKLPIYQWLTAFPQVVSRIGHADVATYKVLSRIIIAVIVAYPLQSIWSMVSVSQSKKEDRLVRCKAILNKVRCRDLRLLRSSEPDAQSVTGLTGRQ